MKEINIHLFQSDIVNQSRIEKETALVLQERIAEEVYIYGQWRTGLDQNQTTRGGAQIFRHKSRINIHKFKGPVKSIISYLLIIEFGLSFIKYCKKKKPTSISVHNPLMLPFGYMASRKFKARLIYVPHELEQHRTGLRGFEQKLTILAEDAFVKRVHGMTTVSIPFQEWYQSRYKIENVHAAPNIPIHPSKGSLVQKSDIFREKFSIAPSDIIFIYQGVLAPSRGIDELLETFKNSKLDRHLVLMGYGISEPKAREYSSTYPNIHFQEAVAVNEIIKYTSSADVGLFFTSKELTRSYQYTIANKFYEYAIAGLYLIFSDNWIEQCRLLREENIGSTIPPIDDALFDIVNKIEKSEIAKNVEETSSFRKDVSWEDNLDAIRRAYS